MADTTIPIDSNVRDRLRGEKVGDETYSDVIARLLGEMKNLERSIEETSRDAYTGGYVKALEDHDAVPEPTKFENSEHVAESHYYHWEGRTMPAKRKLEGWKDE